MIRRRSLGALLLLAALSTAQLQAVPSAAGPRVAITTSEGTIVAILETTRAPITSANFLRYVDAHRFEGKTFYRAARAKTNPKVGLIQGGIDRDLPKSFLPIAHEPTTRTGLTHGDGTLSMARNEVGSAMGDFFITVGPTPGLDARGAYPGYAAFGHVISGMDVVHRILAKPTFPGGLSAATFGQTIRQPVRILSVRRVP